MDLDISVDRDGATCRMQVSGEVDVYTSPMLKARIIDAIEDGCTDLVIDLEGVGFIDSSGLGVLVSGLRRVKEHSGSMRLVCTKDNILKSSASRDSTRCSPCSRRSKKPRTTSCLQ